MDSVSSVRAIDSIPIVIAAFEDAGLTESREVAFLRSCDMLLKKRGSVTPKMQGWLDQLLQEGGPRRPSREDSELADLLETSVAASGTQAKFMSIMIARLRSGHQLGERQRSAVIELHERVQRFRGMGDLSQDEMRAMSHAQRVRHGYSSFYTCERPGSFTRVEDILSHYRATGSIGRVDWETISSIMTRLRLIAYPRHSPGDLLYRKPDGLPVVVIGPASANEWGAIGHEVLCEGKQVFLTMELLRKRAPRVS